MLRGNRASQHSRPPLQVHDNAPSQSGFRRGREAILEHDGRRRRRGRAIVEADIEYDARHRPLRTPIVLPVGVRALVVALRTELALLRERGKLAHEVRRIAAIGTDELARLSRAADEAFVARHLTDGGVAAGGHARHASHAGRRHAVAARTPVAGRGESAGAGREARTKRASAEGPATRRGRLLRRSHRAPADQHGRDGTGDDGAR